MINKGLLYSDTSKDRIYFMYIYFYCLHLAHELHAMLHWSSALMTASSVKTINLKVKLQVPVHLPGFCFCCCCCLLLLFLLFYFFCVCIWLWISQLAEIPNSTLNIGYVNKGILLVNYLLYQHCPLLLSFHFIFYNIR